MFKRLAKSRRHSADEVGCPVPPGAIGLDEPPRHELLPRKCLEGQIQALNTALLRVSRNKYTRRSCGDAPTMQSLLASVDERSPASRRRSETDYQTVMAVPAFIVEHEPEKQQSPAQRGLVGVWGRRMSKKIESFRRAGSRESICSPTDRSEHPVRENNNDYLSNNNNNNDNINKNKNKDRLTREPSRDKKSGSDWSSGVESKKCESKAAERKFLSGNSHRSASPFKSFFIRMGSTGMLNSNRGNNSRRSENLQNARITPCEKENLFRSCSTSHLNASPTYVKGDDPSDGIDLLQIGNRRDKTLSCDDLAAHRTEDHVYTDETIVEDSIPQPSSMRSFRSCDFGNSRNESLRKSSSCDLKESKKSNFPYAFLRSKLSVLPEERQQQLNSTKDESRLLKATSEEHLPAAFKIEQSFDGTSTLGRRLLKNSNKNDNRLMASSYPRDNDSWRYYRNSYAESGIPGSSARFDDDRYSLNPSRLEQIEDCYRQEDSFYETGYPRKCRSAMAGTLERYSSDSGFDRRSSAQHQPSSFRERRYEEPNDPGGSGLCDRRFSETSALLNTELEVAATLRHQRRNSAPNTEQRLSSHYVSSNESGYDSDGPRGESTLVSENENMSLRCVNTDSSDTSSVLDSDIEKPMRTSTPACESRHLVESAAAPKDFLTTKKKPDFSMADEPGEDVNGLRWHRSNSGRILPFIHHQDSYPVENSTESLSSAPNIEDHLATHRARLQQDKTRFLSDIIQPPKRIRRCRLVQLDKKDSRESLGIRLAQQRTGQLRYIVVHLENGGIAHRDGRLRLGDEIVQVEGKDLKTLDGLAEVQQFLKSFTCNKVGLVTAYDEALPQVFGDGAGAEHEMESPESHRNVKKSWTSTSFETSERRYESTIDKNSASSYPDEILQVRKRPDNLNVISCLRKKNEKESLDVVDNAVEPQQYLTRHVAKFEKGCGKPSLGFSVVGGRDSPRGEMGIFVRRVFPGGQADVTKSLFQGDEILSLNGKVLRGYTHQEVIELFKAVREGPVELDLARRHRYPKTPVKSAPY